MKTSARALVTSLALLFAAAASAQDEPPADPPAVDDTPAEEQVPESVDVTPVASDTDIGERLRGIMEATGWFADPKVRVEDGVVFLSGEAESDARREWAVALARRTEAVTAVVNNMTVRQADLLDLSPAVAEMRELARQAIQLLPKLAMAAVVLLLTWLLAKGAKRAARAVLQRRVGSELLRSVLANVVALPVVLIGLYLALRLSGLTQLAATVVGGTGLIGLVIGIAFRDIAENFLASLLISVNRPFKIGDLVEVEGHVGFVQSVTTRGTTLMTFEGNHIQIPNATLYKATVTNRTANPNIRLDFVLGIDYADDPAAAQNRVIELLGENEFVLDDPPPMVLVDELAASTINLRIFFWVNAEEHSVIKVKSKVMKDTLRTLEGEGFGFPDGDREVVFPQGVPVRMIESEAAAPPKKPAPAKPSGESEAAGGEDDMSSERQEIDRQAAASRLPDAGDEILVGGEEAGP